jgi:hypothetical protein
VHEFSMKFQLVVQLEFPPPVVAFEDVSFQGIRECKSV